MDDSYKEDWDMGSQDDALGGRRGRGPEAQADRAASEVDAGLKGDAA